MTLWILAGCLTFLAAILMLLPVLQSGRNRNSDLSHEREVYKARIKELEREHDLGRINAEQLQTAISEEGRKLLRFADKPQQTSGLSRGALFITLSITAIATAGLSLFMYSHLGQSGLADQPLQARLKQDPKTLSVQALLQRAEKRLRDHPEDGRGWQVIAPVYMRLGRYDDAISAYRNAIRILGSSNNLKNALGEALSVAADGVVTEEAHALFSDVAKADPGNVKASFFLAIELNQTGKFQEAADAWKLLIKNSPENAPWLQIARQQLALAQNSLNPNQPGNPTQEDIQNAQDMSKEDRQDFINSMVERLANELEENPNNKAGWRRIIRSYIVLGRKDEARSAIEKAQNAFAKDKEFLAELKTTEKSLN